MSCEMCGKFAGPELEDCEVDGARMAVCRECSKFGTKIAKKSDELYEEQETEVTFVKSKPDGKGPSISHVKVKTGGARTRQPTRPRRRRSDLLYSDKVLVEDYGEVIKEERKAKGWSLEDFAKMINEKASLIQKIEKSEFNPPESLIVKIERKLGISLKEDAAAPVYTGTSSQKEPTLGDIVKLKKKKK